MLGFCGIIMFAVFFFSRQTERYIDFAGKLYKIAFGSLFFLLVIGFFCLIVGIPAVLGINYFFDTDMPKWAAPLIGVGILASCNAIGNLFRY